MMPFILGLLLCIQIAGFAYTANANVQLPDGIKAVWNIKKAFRETTATRERVCLNGLWRWQPAKEIAAEVPSGSWGYFKVPGSWPGITSYIQKDSQRIYYHPDWAGNNLRETRASWYQREITIPRGWNNCRVALSVEYLNSYAAVYLDGKHVGEIRFPGGEIDLTSICRVGNKHVLTMLVVAMSLNDVMRSHRDKPLTGDNKGTIARRGLCGDIFLVGEPCAARIGDVKVDTSFRKEEISVSAALKNLNTDGEYTLYACIYDKGRIVKKFNSTAFRKGDLKNGRISFKSKWKPDKLWDIHTPQNIFNLRLSLMEIGDKLLDTAHDVRFGFREFWIEGRDFYLNGTRIFLSSVPLDNAQAGAAWATYAAAKESLLRLKSFGINMVYTHNYGCEPGSHLSFAEILKATDDVGILVSFSQPHFKHYEWNNADAEQKNHYARHVEYYVKAVQNHPSVVMYSMSHNATGYNEDMNPDLIDGINSLRDQKSSKNAKLALRAESIVKRLDQSRIIYHHSSGNLGSMHTTNFYPNFVPAQELSDWFEHWALGGVKPLFTCEFGAPFSWDWTMYRGWYKGKRAYGNAKVPWEFCVAEWNSQFLGDRAFKISPMEKENLRWEAKQFRLGSVWHRWDYPHRVMSRDFDDRHSVFAMYFTESWRAFRTWGVSAISPWEFGHLWKVRGGVARDRSELLVDWENLQRPGFSPDYIEDRYERMDLAFERRDWIPTAAGEAIIRNNQPLLAYIGGKRDRFTGKDHNFFPGETVEKQIIIINNSRETVSAKCEWIFNLPRAVKGSKKITVRTGEQERILLSLDLPDELVPGAYKLKIVVKFSTGEVQDDSFVVHVLSQVSPLKMKGRVALFDPKGETGSLMKTLGIECKQVSVDANFNGFDILIIGKGALTLKGQGPDLSRVREGLKVVVFEQKADVLEKRLGFRVAEYGLRNVFHRVVDHPILNGISAEHLRDWRGEATILSPRLAYQRSSRFDNAPSVKWCGIEATRVWRCGNRGNVASVLIEKPHRGDFLPVADGGFSLQYSPLLEYREGKGFIFFCQMDVTGRTESEPVATKMARNILQYVSDWKPKKTRKAVYVGDNLGKKHLEAAGIPLESISTRTLTTDHVMIVGPGGGKELSMQARLFNDWLKEGGNILAIGLDDGETNAFLPKKISMKRAEHIAAFFKSSGKDSVFAGIGPADIHNRDPRVLPLMSEGDSLPGNGVLASAEKTNAVFCQLVPWQFDYTKQNTKRTYRRTSFLLSRLLANIGVRGSTPLLQRFYTPVITNWEKRWLNGLYLDFPEEWDDPYRFFRW